MTRTAGMLLLAASPALAGAQRPASPPIQDNSFLVEEAYNQEPGVVQHINTLWRARGDWSYSLTQEWPLRGRRHQLGFTVPVERGLGPVAVNYRLQVAGGGRGPAVAPRLSVLFPAARADGGVQLNLPVSAALARAVVTHWNAGATVVRAQAAAYHAGASVVWLARPGANLLVEVLWSGTARQGDVVVNPGVRWAHDLGGVQLVPGVSFPRGRETFFYLSAEHAFLPARAGAGRRAT